MLAQDTLADALTALLADGGMAGAGNASRSGGGFGEGGGGEDSYPDDAAVDVYDPARYVGPLAEILEQVPQGYTVLAAENVIRRDLACRFERLWSQFRRRPRPARGDDVARRLEAVRAKLRRTGQASKSTKGLGRKRGAKRVRERRDAQLRAQERQLVALSQEGEAEREPSTAFHGTTSQAMAPIVRTGLVVPGDKGVRHRTDVGWYGAGIYLSPSAALSLSYASAGKLFVCAALLGRSHRMAGIECGCACKKGYDSHLSPDGSEWVLFQASQVLPVYVLHVTSAASGGRRTGSGSSDAQRQLSLAAEAAAAAEEAAMARASFYIDTKRFNVLEVAPVDEHAGESAHGEGGFGETHFEFQSERGFR